MTLIVQSGSRQYLVEQGQKLIVNRLKDVNEGDSVELDVVYAFGEEAGKTVKATVVKNQRGEKIRVTKYLPKSNYHRQYGPRAEETVLLIGEAKKTSSKAAKAETDSETKTEKVEAKKTVKKTANKATTKKPAAKKTAKKEAK